jgi:hypothetical protein
LEVSDEKGGYRSKKENINRDLDVEIENIAVKNIVGQKVNYGRYKLM